MYERRFLVFLSLQTKTKTLIFASIKKDKDEQEASFSTLDREDGQLVSACYSLAETGTLQRETQGLLKAMQHLGLPEGRIITWDEKRTIHEPAGTIEVQPLWEFLLA